MGKQKKQLIILLIVMVVLFAGYFALRFYNSKSSENYDSGVETVLDITANDVTTITYNYNDVTYTLEKDKDQWIYPADRTVDIDETSMDTMILDATKISSGTIIENVENMGQYGLVNPSRTVTFTTTDGTTYTVLMGDYNATISAYYMCMEGENTVYAIQGYHYTGFDKTPWDLAVTEDSTDTDETAETPSESSEELLETTEE